MANFIVDKISMARLGLKDLKVVHQLSSLMLTEENIPKVDLNRNLSRVLCLCCGHTLVLCSVAYKVPQFAVFLGGCGLSQGLVYGGFVVAAISLALFVCAHTV